MKFDYSFQNEHVSPKKSPWLYKEIFRSENGIVLHLLKIDMVHLKIAQLKMLGVFD